MRQFTKNEKAIWLELTSANALLQLTDSGVRDRDSIVAFGTEIADFIRHHADVALDFAAASPGPSNVKTLKLAKETADNGYALKWYTLDPVDRDSAVQLRYSQRQLYTLTGDYRLDSDNCPNEPTPQLVLTDWQTRDGQVINLVLHPREGSAHICVVATQR